MKPNLKEDHRTVGLFALVAIGLLIAGYSIYAAFPLLMGPAMQISVDTAESGLTRIYGTTARVSFLKINGVDVPVDEKGSFSIERAYPPGYTVLQARAEDRFGRTITRILYLVTPESPHGNEEES